MFKYDNHWDAKLEVETRMDISFALIIKKSLVWLNVFVVVKCYIFLMFYQTYITCVICVCLKPITHKRIGNILYYSELASNLSRTCFITVSLGAASDYQNLITFLSD